MTLVSFASPTAKIFPAPHCFGNSFLVADQVWCGIGSVPGGVRYRVKPVTHPSTLKPPYGDLSWFVDGVPEDAEWFYWDENDNRLEELLGCVDLLLDCHAVVTFNNVIDAQINNVHNVEIPPPPVTEIVTTVSNLYDCLGLITSVDSYLATIDNVHASYAIVGMGNGYSVTVDLKHECTATVSDITYVNAIVNLKHECTDTVTTVTGVTGEINLKHECHVDQPGAFSSAFSNAFDIYITDY